MKPNSDSRTMTAGSVIPALLLGASLVLCADRGAAQTLPSANSRADVKEVSHSPATAPASEIGEVSPVEVHPLENDVTEKTAKASNSGDKEMVVADAPRPSKLKKDEAATGKVSPSSAPANPQDSGGSEPEHRYAVFVLGGVNIPHDDFSEVFDPGFSFSGGLEYIVTHIFSIEGIFGYNRFRVSLNDHANLYQFSGNAKLYVGEEPARLFVNGGGGVYNLDGDSTRGGVNVGGGLQVNIKPGFAVEGGYNFHNVFTSGQDVKFSTVQGGVRFRF